MKRFYALIIFLLIFGFSMTILAEVSDPSNRFMLGIKALNNREYEKAKVYFEELLSEANDNYVVLMYLCYIYFREGEYQNSLKAAEKCMSLKNDCILSMFITAEINYQWQNLPASIEMFKKILEYNTEIRSVYIRLYELLKESDPKNAHKYYLLAFKKPDIKLEAYLPKIEEYELNIPDTGNDYITSVKFDLKGLGSDTNNKDIFDREQDLQESGDTNEIIMTVKAGKIRKGKKKVNIVMPAFSKDDFVRKMTRFLITGIFLIILGIMRSNKEKKLKEMVLDNYRFRR